MGNYDSDYDPDEGRGSYDADEDLDMMYDDDIDPDDYQTNTLPPFVSLRSYLCIVNLTRKDYGAEKPTDKRLSGENTQ